MKGTIDRLEEKVAFLCLWIAAYLILPIMIVVMTVDMTLRYFFSAPLSWGHELATMGLFTAFILGLMSAWIKRVHVKMEMLYEMAPNRLKRCGDVITAVCGLIVFAMLGWQGMRDIPYMVTVSEASEILGLPLWLFRLLTAVISILLCLQLLLFLVRAVQAMLIGKERSHDSI